LAYVQFSRDLFKKIALDIQIVPIAWIHS